MHTIHQYLGQPILKGTEQELFFVQPLQNGGVPLFYSAQANYRTQNALFEISGKSKTRRQLKSSSLPSYLVKDEISASFKGEIPLFQCGFIY